MRKYRNKFDAVYKRKRIKKGTLRGSFKRSKDKEVVRGIVDESLWGLEGKLKYDRTTPNSLYINEKQY